MEFSHDLALALVQSDDEFPVDLDDAWQWLGYKEKRSAKEVLLGNFEDGLDFLGKGTKSNNGGRPSEHIGLTVDCFKSLGMMAGTENGKVIRRYFLECERQAKQEQAPQLDPSPFPTTPLPPSPLATDLALIRSLLQVKPTHPFVRWQGALLASTQAVADWLAIDADKARGYYNRRQSEFQALGMVTRAIPKTLRAKLELSNKTNNLRLWTPRALVRLAELVADHSPTAQKLIALTGSQPQLAALSLDDQISELYQRAVEAEGIANQAGKSALLLYLELGEKLTQRKAELPHGEWTPYLRQRRIHPRRSQRAMQLWEGRDQLEGALKDLTLTQALNQISTPQLKAEPDLEPATTTVDVTPHPTPLPQLPPPDPKLLVLDRLQQATRTATEIEALPADSTLKSILTTQLSRAVQLMNFEDLTKDITPTKPVIEPDPLTIADYAKLNGRNLSPFQIQQAGIQAARMYRNRHGANPQQRGGIINGEVRPVNLYPASDWDLVESAIALAVEA